MFRHLGGRWEGSYTLRLISIGNSCSRRVMSNQLLSDTRCSERRGQRLEQPSDCKGQNLDPPSGESCRRALSQAARGGEPARPVVVFPVSHPSPALMSALTQRLGV